jgi:hypothetical protein
MVGCLLLFPLTQEWRSFLSCQIFCETGNVERTSESGRPSKEISDYHSGNASEQFVKIT